MQVISILPLRKINFNLIIRNRFLFFIIPVSVKNKFNKDFKIDYTGWQGIAKRYKKISFLITTHKNSAKFNTVIIVKKTSE